MTQTDRSNNVKTAAASTFVGSKSALRTTRSRATGGSKTPRPAAAPATAPSEITATKKDEVGFGKIMETKARLYRNGHLVVDTHTRNDNWTGGLRGKVLVVAVDAHGRSIWVSKEFRCATRCSVPDVTCASQGRETFTDSFPAPVGEMTRRLDIYQADTPSYVNMRDSLVRAIRDTISVINELKPVLGLLK